jgi:hypothetical protein
VDIERLPEPIRKKLAAITPSRSGGCSYYPCTARLHDGRRVPRVLFSERGEFEALWGPMSDEDIDRLDCMVSLTQIRDIDESRERLGAEFANQLYSAGESGMGYIVFQVVLEDGRRFDYLTGDIVDFLEMPEGVDPTMIVAVIPHGGDGRVSDARLENLDYKFCVFSDALP